MDFIWENVFCYTTRKVPLNFDGQDLGEQLTQFENAFSLANAVEIREKVPQEVSDFLYRYFGFGDFEKRIESSRQICI